MHDLKAQPPMMNFRDIRNLALWALAATLLVACGGGVDRDRSKAQLRLVNASGYSQLDLRVEGTVRQSNVAYGATADYVTVDPDETDTTISRGGAATALLTLTPAVSKDRSYTLLAYGREGALRSLLIDDNTAAPANGRALLQVLNAAPDAGPLDIFLTGNDEPLTTAVPLKAAAVAGDLGTALTVNSGTWRLRVTGANDRNDLRLDFQGLVLNSQQVATLLFTPGRGGVLVNALLVSQKGSLTRLDTTLVRVRAVAGVASGGAVSASIGSRVLMSSVGSPAVGLYAALTAGTLPVTLAVNGSALVASPMAFAAGGDYTLLLYGSPVAARFKLLEDDNRPASNSAAASVRLVNGVADLAGPVSMTADFVPVADAVAAGDASAYAAVAASTIAKLSITSPGLTTPLFSAVDQRLDAGAVYTVFLLGSGSAPTGVLRKDR